MNSSTIIEAIGYLGSALVLVSFLMSSVLRLRLVNTAGSLLFAIYALIIRSYPTAVMNIALVLINLRFLWKLRRDDPSYRLLSLKPEEGYVQDFLRQYAEDIAKCFPGRRPQEGEPNRAWMVFHGSEPAGILLGREEDGKLDAFLDYTTPAYRDCSVGAFLLDSLRGVRLIRYTDAEESHLAYLRKLGFTEKDGVWEKTLQG